MGIVVFEARGPIAHFRRPDTLGTHATYPFITRTALRGLAASILGRDSVPAEVRCGIRLLSPVRTVTQELSLHGKTWVGGGAESSFSRPTSIQLVIQPAYRLFYEGPLADELAGALSHSRSHYHTYLGSAFCLTFPRFIRKFDESDTQPVYLHEEQPLECASVLPVNAVRRLLTDEGLEYARVGGLLYEHLGERRFRGTINILYEVSGTPVRFLPKAGREEQPWRFRSLPEEGIVCLW